MGLNKKLDRTGVPSGTVPGPVPYSRHIFLGQDLQEFIELSYNKQYSVIEMSPSPWENGMGLEDYPRVVFPTPDGCFLTQNLEELTECWEKCYDKQYSLPNISLMPL